MLKRFWFEFEHCNYPTVFNIGCGVTAYDYDDAVNILKERMFSGQVLPTITRVIPDVDVRELDQGHVIPNMGLVTQRGVWFPLSF